MEHKQIKLLLFLLLLFLLFRKSNYIVKSIFPTPVPTPKYIISP